MVDFVLVDYGIPGGSKERRIHLAELPVFSNQKWIFFFHQSMIPLHGDMDMEKKRKSAFVFILSCVFCECFCCWERHDDRTLASFFFGGV